MSAAVTNVWRQLVQRRLWPVAIVLVAALAAVPMLLAKEPESSADPVPVAKGGDDENILASQPIVSEATAADFAARRHVLGNKKNPFHVEKPAEAKDAKSSSTGTNPAPGQSDDSDGGSTGSTGGAPAGGSPTPTPGVPTPTTPTEPTAPARTYDKYDLTVRFGDGAAMERMTLPRLQPLPKADLPVLMYLGVSKDGKSALFLLEKGVQAVGDGDCDPNPEDCETLRLGVDETEFLDVVDEAGNVTGQYQLDLIKIHKGSTASAAKASASSKAGRKLLAVRAESKGALPYRFDADSGTLERRSGSTRSVATNVAAGAGALR